MERWIAAGDHFARIVVGTAIAAAAGVLPRLGRGVRPMPIDPSVQDDLREPVLMAAEAPAPQQEPLRPAARAA